MTEKTRGKAAPDRQLSVLQRRILVWIFRQQSTIETFCKVGKNVGIAGKGIPTGYTFNQYIKLLRQKGIPWSAKRYYDAVPTELESKSLSRALIALEKRGLLVRYDITAGLGQKSRTTHVRLTKIGRDAAHFFIECGGKSERELKDHLTPAERFVRNHIHYLKGRLKTEKAYLEMLEERHEWNEMVHGRSKSPWAEMFNAGGWIEVAESNLSDAQRNVEKTEAEIKKMETFRDYEALDRLMQNPKLKPPTVPWRIYEVLLERAR